MSFWKRFLAGSAIKNTPQIEALSRDKKDILQSYLNACSFSKKMPITDAPLVAVDFETTGLNPKFDEIISMGFCPMKYNQITLADCLHFVVSPNQSLTSDNVVIHGLTDDTVSQGICAEDALMQFLKLTQGKVIVAHYHSIERSFIQALSLRILGMPIPLNIIDTCVIAKQRMERRNQVIGTNSLRLFNLRAEFGLPNYKAHNALEDAISTAELLMAQLVSFNMPMEDITLGRMGLFHYKS